MEKIDKLVTNIQLLSKKTDTLLGEHVARPIYNSIMDAYQKETDPATGVKWKKLSDATLKAKKGRGRILYHQGNMQDNTAWKVEDSTAFIGTNAAAKGYAYPAVHQFGSKKTSKRRFLPVTDDGALSDKLTALVENALARKLESLML